MVSIAPEPTTLDGRPPAAGRQPRRDRATGVRDLPPPRHLHRGRALRRGRRPALRPRGRHRRAPAGERAGRHLPAQRPAGRRGRAGRCRRRPPRLRLPLRERRLRPRRDRGRPDLGRAEPGVDRGDGLEGARQGAHAEGRGAGPRGTRRARRAGPPPAGEGFCRRRWPRHAGGPGPRRPAGRGGRGERRGGQRVRRRHRLRRALRRARAPCRGAGPGSPDRRPGARRTRLLGPASTPEGDRGVPRPAPARPDPRRPARRRPCRRRSRSTTAGRAPSSSCTTEPPTASTSWR